MNKSKIDRYGNISGRAKIVYSEENSDTFSPVLNRLAALIMLLIFSTFWLKT